MERGYLGRLSEQPALALPPRLPPRACDVVTGFLWWASCLFTFFIIIISIFSFFRCGSRLLFFVVVLCAGVSVTRRRTERRYARSGTRKRNIKSTFWATGVSVLLVSRMTASLCAQLTANDEEGSLKRSNTTLKRRVSFCTFVLYTHRKIK